jgi:hypothetical protein
MARETNIIERQKQMQAKGRQPSYDAENNIRGYRTRPGAAQSPQNRASDLVRDPETGLSTEDSWRRMFPNSPAAQPAASTPVLNPDATAFATAGGTLPPPEAFSPMPRAELKPERPPVMTGIAEIKARPGSASDMMADATARNERFLRESVPGGVIGRTTTPEGNFAFLQSKYGSGFARPARVAMGERMKDADLRRRVGRLETLKRSKAEQQQISNKYDSELQTLINRWSM